MLKSPKKVELREVPSSHEDLFAQSYDELRKWALQLTEHDAELASDLLHDAYVQFTLARPRLESIENLNGYLYVLMRNLHFSQMRRLTRVPTRSMSVVEFDTVDVGFWASDPRDRMRMRDELGAVCRFACIRKESSKGGSLLILRFFHGYYPEEIARILCSTRAGVYERLRRARAEARLYLEEPERLAFIDKTDITTAKLEISDSSGDDLRGALRRQIFSSCRGEHAPQQEIAKFYKSGKADGLERRRLAHIVSCPSCLENVNSLLGLPPLSSRYPLDTIGNDPGSDDRSGGSGGGGGTTGGDSSGSGGSNVFDTFVSRRDAHYYHEPQELCISVNGQLQGFQKVVSGKGELTLILENDNVGFVEVFSDQGLRLLMLNVEPPPAGDGNQSARVNLSSGRTVDANLNFSGSFPALRVTYNDPELAALATVPELTETPDAAAPETTERPVISLPFESDRSRLKSIFSGWRNWFRPLRLTTAVAALLVTALLIYQFGPAGKVSASELLTKSAANESAQLASKERVLHRTIDLEEYRGGEIASRKRIDVWQSSERGITARRLYDEQGRLAAGDWRSSNGIQTVYTRGAAPRLQPPPEKRVIGFDDAWQLSLTAGEFAALVKNTSQAEVETREHDYLISYTPPGAVSGDGVTKAAIVLAKEDLRAVEQTFAITTGGETREFRMAESAYEWRPSSAVAPAVFEPNVELTGSSTALPTRAVPAEVGSTPEVPTGANLSVPANTNAASSPAADIATPALEVEVVEALNNAGAFTGEQIDVSRSGDGKLQVTGLVETPARKQALVNALASFKNNPAVRVRIETVEEAEARVKQQMKRRAPRTQTPGAVEQVEVTEGMSAVYAELRKKLSEDEARRFADRVLSGSRQVRLHALAMKQLSGRFSEADLKTLTPDERARWLALIHGHAEALVREAEALRRDLQQFFPEAAAGSSGGGAINGDAELEARARELYEASLVIDRGLSRSFALTAGASSGAPVKSQDFWRSFAEAVGKARSLANAR